MCGQTASSTNDCHGANLYTVSTRTNAVPGGNNCYRGRVGSSIETFIARIRAKPRTALALVAAIGAGLTFWHLPANTLHPFCTYRAQYRLDATLQVGGELLTSSVVRQSSQSRQWIYVMNSGGCGQRYGTALTFRAKDDRVFLIHADICQSAEKFPENPVDVIEHCSQNWPYRPIGFIVDSASKPTTWKPFNFLIGDQDAKLISMKATPTWHPPSDDLEKSAPNILKSVFETDNVNGWSNSPERIISFERRHGNTEFNVRISQTRPSRIDDSGERARRVGHRAVVPQP
jgi:hypothetical protein